MKKIISILFFIICSIINIAAFAQDQNADVEMADVMRSNGKIYVVLAVVLVIFVGLILYLISIDRKVSKMERDLQKK